MMKTIGRWVPILLLGVFCRPGLGARADQGPRADNPDFFRALAMGFRANRDAIAGVGHLRFLQCLYMLPSVQAALAGQYAGDPPGASIFWAVSGRTQRYDEVWDEGLLEASLKPKRGGGGSFQYLSYRVVCNDRVYISQNLSDQPGVDALPKVAIRVTHMAGIMRGSMRTPFAMLEINAGHGDFHDLAYHIEQALADPQRSLRYEGERADLKGRQLAVLAFSNHGKVWLRVWIDRSRSRGGIAV